MLNSKRDTKENLLVALFSSFKLQAGTVPSTINPSFFIHFRTGWFHSAWDFTIDARLRAAVAFLAIRIIL